MGNSTDRLGEVCAMLAKRFMFVSIGVLALGVGFALFSGIARGQASAFRVLSIGHVLMGDSVYFLERTNFPVGWKQMPYGGRTLPPVPPSSLVQYDGIEAITDSGEGWGLVGGVWTDLGPIPSTPTTQASWGQVKAKYLH